MQEGEQPEVQQQLNLVHHVLQFIGLAPFTLAPSPEKTRLNKLLTCYNVILATLTLINAYYSQVDERNNFMYTNKTDIIDIAYDAVDVLGSIYVSLFILMALTRYKRAGAITFKARRISKIFMKLGIHFDHMRTEKYFTAKLVAVCFCSAAFMSITIYLEERVGNNYTILYWVMILHPKLFASTLIMVFGSCAAEVYGKIWVVNEFLRIYIEEYSHLGVKVPTEGWKGQLLNERRLEEFILARQIEIVTKKRLFHKLKKTGSKTGEKKKPLLVFIKNYPQCFKRINRDILTELRVLREVHFEILELGELISDHFGSHFLCIFVMYFFGVIINVYSAVTFHITQVFEEEYAFAIIWAFVYLVLTVYIVAYSNLAVGEANQTIMLVHKFWIKIKPSDAPYEKELQTFAMQLVNNPLKFTAAGFFTVNSALLFSFLTGVVSNVIFVVQFDKFNLQETLRAASSSPPLQREATPKLTTISRMQ